MLQVFPRPALPAIVAADAIAYLNTYGDGLGGHYTGSLPYAEAFRCPVFALKG
jgi:hypothetical protein